MSDGKNIFYGRAVLLDITIGEELSVLLNEHEAWEHGIHSIDKVALVYDDGSEIVVNADLSKDFIKQGQVGVTRDVAQKYGIQEGEHLGIYFTKRSNAAVDAIKKRLTGHDLTDDDIYAIIKDISDNKLTDTMITYYAASNFVKEADLHELAVTAKAMADCGEKVHFEGVVADKHCIGGVPGNETTMIIVPTIAALGIKIPKVFSKAITSPAATGECVEVLMNNTFTAEEIEDIVKDNNCSLIWGGGLSLAPADDKIIKVSYPLSMQSYDKMISSIMAKQYAMGINHCLIDIPMGPTAKVSDEKTAQELIEKFKYVGEYLGMKMDVQITPAEQPIGRGIGAILQVREVLRVLQQHEKKPEDLENKAMFLASKIVELVGLAKGEDALKMCFDTLRSGKSWEMMQKIIKRQAYKVPPKHKYFEGNPWDVNSEDLIRGEHKHEITSKVDGEVKAIDMKYLNMISRTLGTPLEAQAGVYLDTKMGDRIKVGDPLYTLYSNDKNKLEMALDMLESKDIYTVS